MKKKISVIIPCYNAAEWLPKCFLSLVQQTIGIENLELIFVNDASTDNNKTWSLLVEFERAYPESIIIVNLEENKRQGGARNAALLYATGEYLSFVDADDWVKLELYEAAYKKAKETEADIVQFNHCFYSEKTGVFENPAAMEAEDLIIISKEDRIRLLMSEKITYGCWNKLYRRELVIEAGVQFAEHTIYEEPLFVYPLLYFGKRYTVMPDRFYIYRQNDAGTMRGDMKAEETLLQHAHVQLELWYFMKQTVFYEDFYEEIKLYFLHTCMYETLYFAKLRGLSVTMDLYRKLEKIVLEEVKDMGDSVYEEMIPVQMRLYRLVLSGMTGEKLADYMNSIPASR